MYEMGKLLSQEYITTAYGFQCRGTEIVMRYVLLKHIVTGCYEEHINLKTTRRHEARSTLGQKMAVRRQAIAWGNGDLLSIRPLATNFN